LNPERTTRFSIGVMGRVLDQMDGLGIYSMTLIKRMVELDRDTRYVLLLARPQHADVFRDYGNVEAHVLPARSKLWWDQMAVPAAARRFKVDVLFNPKFSVPLLTDIPSAFVLQSADWYVNPQNYTARDNLYIRMTLPLYCRKARQLLAISHSTVEDLAKHIRLNRERVTVTYAGVASNFTPQQDPEALRSFKARYQLPDDFILTVARAYHTGMKGRIAYPGGNNERLVRAYQQYRARGGKRSLIVAGKEIAEYLRDRGFGDSALEGIQFIGFVPNDSMHNAYQLASCFVLATLCESFGLPILEAMSCGCPAIVPSTCAAPEVGGDAVRLIDPRDEQSITQALLTVGSSPELRTQMRQLGLQRAQQFTWNETARQTIAAVKRAAQPV
jgi:glycosyltransferase involved in cell wall biosynthesis